MFLYYVSIYVFLAAKLTYTLVNNFHTQMYVPGRFSHIFILGVALL